MHYSAITLQLNRVVDLWGCVRVGLSYFVYVSYKELISDLDRRGIEQPDSPLHRSRLCLAICIFLSSLNINCCP